jgi:hypothetical protein
MLQASPIRSLAALRGDTTQKTGRLFSFVIRPIPIVEPAATETGYQRLVADLKVSVALLS